MQRNTVTVVLQWSSKCKIPSEQPSRRCRGVLPDLHHFFYQDRSSGIHTCGLSHIDRRGTPFRRILHHDFFVFHSAGKQLLIFYSKKTESCCTPIISQMSGTAPITSFNSSGRRVAASPWKNQSSSLNLEVGPSSVGSSMLKTAIRAPRARAAWM